MRGGADTSTTLQFLSLLIILFFLPNCPPLFSSSSFSSSLLFSSSSSCFPYNLFLVFSVSAFLFNSFPRQQYFFLFLLLIPTNLILNFLFPHVASYFSSCYSCSFSLISVRSKSLFYHPCLSYLLQSRFPFLVFL